MSAKLFNAMQRLVGSDVRGGEARVVAVMFVNLLLLMTAYYILKVVREPLIMVDGGAVLRSYARGAQAAVLMLVVPAYAALAQRLEPSRLVNRINAGFLVTLMAFVLLLAFGVNVGFPFFVWLGIFSTFVIAQFWSLANDLFSQSEGKRCFPLVAVGGTLGGVFGAQVAAQGLAFFGIYELMSIAGLLLVVCMVLTTAGQRQAKLHLSGQRRAEAVEEGTTGARKTDLLSLASDKYLVLIGVSVLLLNLINTTGDFVLAELVSREADVIASASADPEQARTAYIGAFYGNFQTAVSVLAALLQLFVVARVFRSAGVERALLFLPLFVLAGYGVTAMLPALALLVVIKVTENSTDYSLQNTVQQALFLPTSRAAKYQGKTAIDTFLVRVGDLLSTSLVFVGAQVGLAVSGFAWVNVALAALWVMVAMQLASRHRALSASSSPPPPPPRGPLPAVARAAE